MDWAVWILVVVVTLGLAVVGNLLYDIRAELQEIARCLKGEQYSNTVYRELQAFRENVWRLAELKEDAAASRKN